MTQHNTFISIFSWRSLCDNSNLDSIYFFQYLGDFKIPSGCLASIFHLYKIYETNIQYCPTKEQISLLGSHCLYFGPAIPPYSIYVIKRTPQNIDVIICFQQTLNLTAKKNLIIILLFFFGLTGKTGSLKISWNSSGKGPPEIEIWSFCDKKLFSSCSNQSDVVGGCIW